MTQLSLGATKTFRSLATSLMTGCLWLTLATSTWALAQGPRGDPLGPGNEVHDQRTGSILIYNFYTSVAAGAADTRFTLTNSHETQGVHLQLNFVDGATGQVRPATLDLGPAQTQSFLASEIDPGSNGYLIAIALSDNHYPIQFDFLMGSASITLTSGLRATLGALAVPIKPDTAGASYAALPRQLTLDHVTSPSDSVKQMLVINRLDGDLTGYMPAIGRLRCDLFNQAGARFSFTSRSFGPQVRAYYNNLVNPGFTATYLFNYLPAGQSGWLRARPVDAGAISGAVLYFKESGGTTTPHPGGYNLRHLTNTPATLQLSTGSIQFGY